MPTEVQQGRRNILQCLVAFVELVRGNALFKQTLWNRFTGLVMSGVVVENLRMNSPVLVERRWELDEIAWHRCTGQSRILNLGEQTMNSMPKLMKHRHDMVQTQQRRLSRSWHRYVHHVDNHW